MKAKQHVDLQERKDSHVSRTPQKLPMAMLLVFTVFAASALRYGDAVAVYTLLSVLEL